MKNLKIGKKLLVTFGIIIAMLSITVIVGVLSLIQVRGNFTTFYENPYVVNNYAMDMRRSLQNMAKFFGYATMTTDVEETAEYIQAAEEELTSLRDGTIFMEENFIGDKSLITKYDAAMNSIKEIREQAFEAAKENKNDEAIQIYFDEVNPGLLEAQEYLQKIADTAQINAKDSYTAADSIARISNIMLLVIAIIALVLTVVLAFYLTRSLTRPINEIESVANKMAEGELNVQVQYTSRDELGGLSNSIRRLITNLRGIIGDVDYLLEEIADGDFRVQSKHRDEYVGDFSGILLSMQKLRDGLNNTMYQINQSADQVAAGSDQVSSAAQSLSQGATEQASSVEELAATINEISSQVKETAENANEARRVTDQTGEQVATSNQQMQEMIVAMDEISDKSGQISKIIKTIEDIAFQTNILALNAAVEAARAGTAGKGFAIVADEVRNLASKSSEASKSTAALIEGTVQAVKKGTGIANSTAESLLAVVRGTKEAVSTVDRIALAAGQQAESIEQVTQGIDQISSVVQTNSATAEESAAASQELSGQSQMLKSLVGQFKLCDVEGMDRNVQTEQFSTPKVHVPLPNEGKY